MWITFCLYRLVLIQRNGLIKAVEFVVRHGQLLVPEQPHRLWELKVRADSANQSLLVRGLGLPISTVQIIHTVAAHLSSARIWSPPIPTNLPNQHSCLAHPLL